MNNPQSLFLYNNPKYEDNDYSILTNFEVELLGEIITYDIIRISADGAADLTQVKEVIRHEGIGVESIYYKIRLEGNHWTNIDFPIFKEFKYLTTSEVNTDGSETITMKEWFEIMRQNSNNIFVKLYWDQEGVSLDWLNQNAELMKEPSSQGSKWEDLKWGDVVISIRNKTKEDTSNPIFDKKPRHILLYTHFKLNDNNDLQYDEYKLLFNNDELARFNKDKDPNLLYLPPYFGKVKPYGTSNYKKKKHPLKRFYPKAGNKRNYYLFQKKI